MSFPDRLSAAAYELRSPAELFRRGRSLSPRDFRKRPRHRGRLWRRRYVDLARGNGYEAGKLRPEPGGNQRRRGGNDADPSAAGEVGRGGLAREAQVDFALNVVCFSRARKRAPNSSKPSCVV